MGDSGRKTPAGPMIPAFSRVLILVKNGEIRIHGCCTLTEEGFYTNSLWVAGQRVRPQVEAAAY